MYGTMALNINTNKLISTILLPVWSYTVLSFTS